jgi:hypothetical protein
MRRIHGYAAAGITAALIAVPLPAMADETTDTATGDLTVTRFDDRYADGLFDASKTAPSGDVDALNTSYAAQLVDVNGTRWYVSADADGIYRFTDVPVGAATLFLGHDPSNTILFDATGATSAADIEQLPTTEYFGSQGTINLIIDEDGETRLVGMTALRLVANVQFADGTPAPGLTSIELGSGGDWYPATEYSFQAGTYEAFKGFGYVYHLPGDLGVRVTAPEGYRVANVTAGDITQFTVTERDGAYYFDSGQVWNYFWNPAFTVTLEEIPPADTTAPTVTVKDGARFTVRQANGKRDAYNKVTFTLADEGQLASVSINGAVTPLSGQSFDLGAIKAGTFGAVTGTNTLVVTDAAGNAQTLTFILS